MNVKIHVVRTFISSVFLGLIFPVLVLAQSGSASARSNLSIKDIFNRLSDIFNIFIPFLILLGTTVFLWGITKYITAGGDENKIKEGRNMIVWGIIALAAILAVWGLVTIITTALFGNEALPPIPGPDLDAFL